MSECVGLQVLTAVFVFKFNKKIKILIKNALKIFYKCKQSWQDRQKLSFAYAIIRYSKALKEKVIPNYKQFFYK